MTADAHARDRDEEQRERYRELLEELRTVIPGVQVLLAFLLTVPFSARFTELDPLGTALFVVTLATATLSVVVLLVPTVFHRLSARVHRRTRLRIGVRSTLAGLALLGMAMATALFVVVRFIYDLATGLAVAALIIVSLGGAWLLLPLWLRRRR